MKLAIKKFKTFPSLEWGDNGGFCCDVYFEGKLQGHLHQAGEGGTYYYDSQPDSKPEKELADYFRNYLKRNKFARLVSGYSLDTIDKLVDLESAVLFLSTVKALEKDIKKLSKTQYDHFYVVAKEPEHGMSCENWLTLRSVTRIPNEEIKAYISKKSGWKDANPEIYVMATVSNLETLLN